jgi:hypothetical protein
MRFDLFYSFAILFLAHWIWDFVGQSDKMAINKSKSWYWLNTHSAVYCIGMCLSSAVVFSNLTMAALTTVVVGVSHWAIDAVTSRINAQLYINNQRHWFFVSIGFDQFLHNLAILYCLTEGMKYATG